MTDFLQRYGQWGIVLGAAEGIGASFCREMAGKGMNLVMVDVNPEGMESLSASLEHGILTRILPRSWSVALVNFMMHKTYAS